MQESQIAGQHPRLLEAAVVKGQRVVGGGVEGLPLVGAAGALDEGPLVVEQGLEEVVGPLGGRLAPGDLEARREGPGALLEAASPSELLLAEVSSLGGASQLAAVEGSVCLACKEKWVSGLFRSIPEGEAALRIYPRVAHRVAEEDVPKA